MAAAFLCGQAGIENGTIDSSASYISNWWSRLSEDQRLLIHSATGAQKAADYILGETIPLSAPTSPDSESRLPLAGHTCTEHHHDT